MLLQCLKSLEAQELPKKQFEVIVVNDGSTDNTAEVLQEFKHQTKLNFRFYNRLNSGPAITRNFGISKAQAPWVVFLDDDCVAPKGWLQAYRQEIETTHEPYLSGFGGRVTALYPQKKVSDFFEASGLTRQNLFRPGSNERLLNAVITANVCFKKEVLLEVGGFDERMPFPGGEDLMLSQIIGECGYKIKYIAKAFVWHEDKNSWEATFKTAHNYGRGEYLRLKAGMLDVPPNFNQVLPYIIGYHQKVIGTSSKTSLLRRWEYRRRVAQFFKKLSEGFMNTKAQFKEVKEGLLSVKENYQRPPRVAILVQVDDFEDAKRANQLFGLKEYRVKSNLEWHILFSQKQIELPWPQEQAPQHCYLYQGKGAYNQAVSRINRHKPIQAVCTVPKGTLVFPSYLHLFHQRQSSFTEPILFLSAQADGAGIEANWQGSGRALYLDRVLENIQLPCFTCHPLLLKPLQQSSISIDQAFYQPLMEAFYQEYRLVWGHVKCFQSAQKIFILPEELTEIFPLAVRLLYLNQRKALADYRYSKILPALLGLKIRLFKLAHLKSKKDGASLSPKTLSKVHSH